MRNLLTLLFSSVLLSAFVTPLNAATLYVWTNSPNPGLPFNDWTNAARDIQTAIDAAADGDTVLVTNGVYDTGGVTNYPFASPLTNRVAIHRPITVCSVNGPTVTSIEGAKDHGVGSGDAAVRCVYMTNGALLIGFTLTNGATLSDGDGGGVWCHSTNAVISNCVLIGNSASGVGGGSYFGTFNNCTFVSNSAFWHGGAASDSVLNNCDFVGNGAGDGGAGYYVTMNNCTITNNRAYSGGGAFMSTLNNCTLVRNSASHFGGGAENCTLNNCTITDNAAGDTGGGADSCLLSRCVLVGNSAGGEEGGGGAYASTLRDCMLTSNSAPSGGATTYGTLNNCTLSGNFATADGGGAAFGTLHDCLLIGNSAGSRGGGALGSSLYNCTLVDNSVGDYGGGTFVSTLYNCIVCSNSAPTAPNYSGGSFVNSCTTPLPGGPGNITNDPQFVDAAAGNYRLKAGSPCIDKGSNELVQGTTDLDGNPRIVHVVVDMGAYEFQFVTHYVDLASTESVVPYTNWVTAATNIQDAIDAAADGDTVLVTNGVYDTGGTTNYPFGSSLTNRVSIYKPITVCSVDGPSVTVIRGAWDPAFDHGLGNAAIRCVYMTNGATLIGFTLTNGATFTNLVGALCCGGGVFCPGADAVLSNCFLTGNAALAGGGSSDGTLNNCTLSGNTATLYGGGSYYGTLNNCTLSDNSAVFGGGAYVGVLYNCILVDNSVTSVGGGSYFGMLYNCTLSGNWASTEGGGAYYGALYNCVVYFNTASYGYGPNYTNSTLEYCCTTPDPGGTGNITNEPRFVNAAAGNYRLSAASPCVDKGSNVYVHAIKDPDGNPRIVHGVVDMGAYEFQGYWAWTMGITNGLTNSGDCATGDGYPNLLKYATGSCPTNSDDVARLSGSHGSGLLGLFNRNTNAVDVTLIVEAADAVTNDVTWAGVATNINGSWGGATNVEESGTDNPISVVVRDTDAEGLATNRFMRLRVTQP